MPVLVNSGMNDVRLLGRRWLDKHHRPQTKPGETLDESQHRAARLWLHWAVVAGGGPPRKHHGDQADDYGGLNFSFGHWSSLHIE
jgi:hypothetical protein